MKSTTDMQTDKSKTKQRQMPFQITLVPFFSEVISRHGVKPGPQKLKVFAEMPPPKAKNVTPSIPWNN